MDISGIDKDLQGVIDYLKDELAQIRTGRATTEIIESVKIEAYDTVAPLTNYGNISVSDPKSLVVQAWDKSIIPNIVKGIRDANLGLNPVAEGDHVRVTLPDLTEERRKDMVKIMKERVEKARIGIRNVRQSFMKDIEEAVKGGVSEDLGDSMKKTVEDKVKQFNEEVEVLREAKEKDLMTV